MRSAFFLKCSVVLLLPVSLLAFWYGFSPTPDETPCERVASVARSIINDFSLEPREFHDIARSTAEFSRRDRTGYWQDAFALGARGELFPKHSLLSAIVASPFYGIFGEFGFWFFQQVVSLLLLYYSYQIITQIVGRDMALCSVLVITLGTQTVIGLHTYFFNHDLLAVALIVSGLWFLRVRPCLGGFLAGLSVFTRPAHLLLLPFVLLAWQRKNLRGHFDSLLGAALALGLYAIANYFMFGDPLTSSYQRLPNFNEHGEMVILPHPMGFDLQTLLSDWGAKLWSTKNGLLLYNPCFLALPFVLPSLLTHPQRRFLLITLIGSVVYILYIFSYPDWIHSHFGNRFLFPSIYLYLFSFMAFVATRCMPRSDSQRS